MGAHGWGHGAHPALFLHGFTGNRHAFDHLEPLLGDLLTATCLDLPGHGEAPLQGFLETVDALAARLPGPTVVIGYSQGARLALALAVRHPRLVSQLVLESGSPGLRQRRERLARRQEDEARAASLEALGVDAFVDRWEALPLFAGLARLPDASRLALRSRRTAHSAAGLAGALRSLGLGAQPDFGPSLSRLHVPTLLLTGAADRKFTALAQRMAADLPLAWRRAFEGVGHAPHLECPADYAAELRAFLTARWTEALLPPTASPHPAAPRTAP